jgi:hypothetical protein
MAGLIDDMLDCAKGRLGAGFLWTAILMRRFMSILSR